MGYSLCENDGEDSDDESYKSRKEKGRRSLVRSPYA